MGFLRTIGKGLIAGVGAFSAWRAYSSVAVDHDMPIGPAVDAPREEFHGANSTFLSYYADTSGEGVPILLLHSINAAANAYEVRPLFEHYRGKRPVYALDLPGFGFSERSKRLYSPELYIAAILDFLQTVISEPADVVGLSLTSEFMALANLESPESMRSLTFISPTGFTPSRAKPTSQSASENNQSDGFYKFFTNPIWSQALYDLLVTKPSLRFFLSLNFAGDIDEGLFDYHYRSTHQGGARYAPLSFVSGLLFTSDIFDRAYSKLTAPVLVLYDTDPNVNFDLLPKVLNQSENWRARRIVDTRGLPHFERLDKTTEALDEFWESLTT
ncbi:MAG: alpha/beta fold hydrolase [Chloroflexota bacterium]